MSHPLHSPNSRGTAWMFEFLWNHWSEQCTKLYCSPPRKHNCHLAWDIHTIVRHTWNKQGKCRNDNLNKRFCTTLKILHTLVMLKFFWMGRSVGHWPGTTHIPHTVLNEHNTIKVLTKLLAVSSILSRQTEAAQLLSLCDSPLMWLIICIPNMTQSHKVSRKVIVSFVS